MLRIDKPRYPALTIYTRDRMKALKAFETLVETTAPPCEACEAPAVAALTYTVGGGSHRRSLLFRMASCAQHRDAMYQWMTTFITLMQEAAASRGPWSELPS